MGEPADHLLAGESQKIPIEVCDLIYNYKLNECTNLRLSVEFTSLDKSNLLKLCRNY